MDASASTPHCKLKAFISHGLNPHRVDDISLRMFRLLCNWMRTSDSAVNGWEHDPLFIALSALMESLVTPLQDRIEDWKKTANQLDKDHAKGD